jgi:hypothetical protein
MATTGNLLTPRYLPPRAKRGSGTQVDTEITRVKRIAQLLDGYYIDPIVGLLVPGAGDLITSVFGLYTVHLAVRRKHSMVVISRMLLNLALDAVVGIIPLVGDLFDFGFKANKKNVALLEASAEKGGKATARDWAFVVGAAVMFFGAIGLVIYATTALFRAIL